MSFHLSESMPVEKYREMLAAKSPFFQGKKSRRKSPEEDLHRTCFEWVVLMQRSQPVLKWMIHVPNGGKRPMGEAGKLKAMGVKPGVPDLLIPKASGSWMGLAIELKSPVGRLSDPQREWLAELAGEGYLCSVCRSFGEFESVTNRYLGLVA